jgi:ankyrin repeat protein
VSEAAKAGHLAVVQLIMEKSGMPEVSKPDLGQNPLSSAVEGGHVDIVRYLLQQGLNPTNQKGTPWSYVHGAAPHASAAASGSCELLQLLIEADSRGWQPLHWRDALNKAAAAGHLQSVQLLVSHMPADVWHQLQVLSNHPLSNAAGGGKIEVVQLLIDVAPQGGQTTYWVDAIASAAGGGHLQVVQLLMSRLPVSVHQQPVSERSLPLVSAADGGHADIVQLLLDQGWFDEEGLKEALCFAACRGAVHIMQMLSDKGAVVDSESKGFDPVSPLGAAIRSEQPAAVEWLLSKGASCDKLALVYAVRHSNTPTRSPVMCQALLQGGVQDSNAHALFEAARCGYREVVQLLLSPGSGAPQTEEEQLFRWEVALCGAASMGRVEVVKYLLQAAPATPAPSAAQPPSAASSSASAAPRAAAPAAARNSAAAAPGTVAGAPAGAGSPPPEILECLTKAVEAAVIGGRYTVPANSRCRWVTGEEDFDEEAAFEAEWLWQLAREKSYPMAYGAQGSSEVTRLLVAAGADPDHEKGRVIKTAIRWSAESEAGLLVLDALVDVRRDAKVITSGEACWCAIDSHQYDACCVLLPVTPPGTVDEMELGRLQHMAKSRRDTEMLQLINYHLQAIF